MLLSKDQEVAMGHQSDPEIIAAYGVYPSTELQQFINTEGQKMVKISHRDNIAYEFKILDSPIVNAFAVPGGYVYFTRGIMAHLNSEAEFAGVLGHEIGHIAARHSAKQYSRAMVAQLGLTLGSLASEEFAQFSDSATTGASLLFLKYGRDAEIQSDKLGVEYSTKTGYDAHEMAAFFGTLQRMRGSSESLPVFLSTHPDPGDREKNVNVLADKWQKKDSQQVYKVNRNNYLKKIDGLIYGEDPRQGYVSNQTFYHPELKFYFPVPQGWNLENSPQQVNMTSPAQDAIIVMGLAKEKTLESAVNTLVNQYGLQVNASKRITINNLDAVNLIAAQISQNQTLHLNIYLIRYNNLIYQFIGATTPQLFSQLGGITQIVASGFNQLSDPAKINVKPRRIAIKEVTRNASVSEVLIQHGIQKQNLEEHALLNGMTLNQSIDKGTLIKVIVGENFSDLAVKK
jgi:predicted Zn-dependent protease